jgi:hypothetical protein
MLKPVIGMPLHYYSADKRPGQGVQPQLAFVAYVHSDRLVNVALFDSDGHPQLHPPTSIPLLQDGDKIPKKGAFCVHVDVTGEEAYLLADEPVEEDVDAEQEEEPAKEEPKPKAKGKKPKKVEEPAKETEAGSDEAE